MKDGEDDITFIDARNKKMIINSDTDLEIFNTPTKKQNNSIPMDSPDFKDALLAILYSQVEFLKNQIEEKDLLIRALFIKENDIYNYDTGLSNDSGEISYCEEPLKDSEINFVNFESEEVITDWESYFKSLHSQFEEE